MANTSDIRNGMCIDYNNDIYTIVEFQHVKPGKGNAFVRTKLKSMTSGKVVENTWVAGHTLNEVRVERRKFQYLYKDESGFNFMNTETFDQISLPESMIENGQFLKDGMEIEVIFHAAKEQALTAELPPHVILEVTYTEPGAKGNTATNAMKFATLETGAQVKVPLFIEEGDMLKIDTRTGEYLERSKQ
ncbi:MAG: elongation factor P [Saprospiraceae bacterium]|jgi:elongation factor P|nr:elongation factor P [Saprospiraceae bacterium]MBK7797407.1 elongation factor P [Saprospiraceae bacterium]MBK8153135.1 elongation factor P [Saprospiraceae bacterium]MBK9377226.1 elongation factor P [Saprospiraceae bacterium]MBX7163756.1 elongation factor P [Saprospiraceae bacterium]